MLPSYFKIKILIKYREYSTLGPKGLFELRLEKTVSMLGITMLLSQQIHMMATYVFFFSKYLFFVRNNYIVDK